MLQKPTDWDAQTGTTEDIPLPPPAPSLATVAEAQPAGTATLNGTFGGLNPNGTWNLYIADDGAGDAGTIANGWSLDIAGTTAASLRGFSARRVPRGVALRWQTSAENSILGFDVIRDGGGQSVRVNAGLIRAKAFGSLATGASYVLVDRTARRSTPYTYRLETELSAVRGWCMPPRRSRRGKFRA